MQITGSIVMGSIFSLAGIIGISSGRTNSHPAEATTVCNPSEAKPFFHAIMNQRRAIDEVPGTAIFIDRFSQVTRNTGNAFNSALGAFIAPTDGVYNFSGSIEFENFAGYKVGCSSYPGILEFTIMKNETEKLEEFLFASRNTVEISATVRNFNVLVKLNANDVIRLKARAKACDAAFRPWCRKVVFYGTKIY